jgi:transcriptional regulator with XRE-family HTH domain
MATSDLYSSGFGKRLRGVRERLGWTQEKVGELAGINSETVNRYEAERALPRMRNLERLAKALRVEAEYLRFGTATTVDLSPFYTGKHAPAVVDDVTAQNVHLIDGNHTVPIEISARYNGEPLRVPKRFRPVYDAWLARAQRVAREKGYPFFNGPNTRLCRATREPTRQDPRGHEQNGLMLELGPVSWFEWTVLNMFLDEPFSEDDASITPRAVFADAERLFDEGSDLRWCRLSNILTVNMTPITSDGYGLIQLRNRGGVSTTGGRLANGVAENVHRFLDEAPADNLGLRQNGLQVGRRCQVDASYCPEGVPSPLLAAQRGLWEEVSEELFWVTREASGKFKFLNLMMDLEFFNPHLIGVIELGLPRAQVEKLVVRSPGKDHAESTAIHYIPLDATAAETKSILLDQRRWAAIGLGCVISAIHYWQSPMKGC